MPQSDTARLLIACDDQPGIVAAVAGVLAEHGANIISLDQHSTDEQGGRFFQRTVLHLDGLAAKRPALETSIGDVAERFEMEWSLHDTATRKRVAIFVSKYDHCLMELLWRTQRGELDIDVTMVVSNHPDLAESVRSFGVPFVHIPRGEERMRRPRWRLVSWSCCRATSIWSCSPGTCRSSPTTSSHASGRR
ncbi:ACT domain-containing protein [Microbacterium suwonense]|uniref:ACT domain-containing protein n=1 Tax=Microbacterium suwonense TaxID=683047 RepID=A0ABN6X7D2_9MICO|nr:hypothetical protein GCM10025863_31410 [Microbacterium suwonense]